MSTRPRTEKKDTFQRVTDQIVEAIESGADSFKLPWRTSGGFPASPINAVSRRPYRGINVLILWATAEERGYKSGTWATFKQWQELGAQVRKGEKASHVVFWKFLEREASKDEAEGNGKPDKIPMAKDYWVFNAEQVDGYSEQLPTTVSRSERIQHADSFFKALGVDVRESGNQPCYSPSTDIVQMPPLEAFKEPLYYYSVLSHETTHWTGAEHRLNRDLAGRFHSDSYAMEELVAELGAAFLCSELGLPTDPRRDHAPYIATWLRVFKNDKRAIFTAAAKAQEAVDWMTKKTTTPDLQEAA